MSGRVEKLAKKGMFSVEVDGVLGRLAKGQTIKADLVMELRQFVHAGAIIGSAVRRRMRERKVFASGASWRPTGSGLRVSKKYAKLAGFGGQVKAKKGKLMRVGGARAEFRKPIDTGFMSLADMYAASRTAGAFDVTGGMWRSLTARLWGKLGTRLSFDSTSQGRGKWTHVGDTLRGQPIYERKAKSVRNWQKGSAIIKSLGQNPIELSRSELLAVASAVGSRVASVTARRVDRTASIMLSFQGDQDLARKVLNTLT